MPTPLESRSAEVLLDLAQRIEKVEKLLLLNAEALEAGNLSPKTAAERIRSIAKYLGLDHDYDDAVRALLAEAALRGEGLHEREDDADSGHRDRPPR